MRRMDPQPEHELRAESRSETGPGGQGGRVPKPRLVLPPHAPPVQTYWQADGVPHEPAALQVCWCALSEHCVAFGVHTPPHALPTHVKEQALAVPQVPVALHVCWCVPSEHWVSPGMQLPPHVLPTQAYWQLAGEPNAPAALHV